MVNHLSNYDAIGFNLLNMDIPDCLDQEVLFNNWLAFCSGVFHEAEL